jgi:hypothetical protein
MNSVKIAWILWALVIASFFMFMAAASAEEEKPKEPEHVQDYVQCTYKPSQSDEVINYCGTLKGKGSVSIRICGINYTIDVVCN